MPRETPTTRRNRHIAWTCGAVALGMVGLAFAAVPLYDLFCRTTGFDGRPFISALPPEKVLDRIIEVRFDANVAPGLNWKFSSENPEITLRLGELKTIHYKVRNNGSTPGTGIATFNVQPDLAGSYFVKIQCFCFTEQTLQPGEERDEAVMFYIDPSLVLDRNIADLPSITLSYTFFPSRNGNPAAKAPEAAPDTQTKL